MSASSCFSSGGSIFCSWVIPETLIHAQLGQFYQESPFGSRVIATPLALISGIIKLFLFPLICAVGIVVMPIIALIRVCQGKKDLGPWLGAWAFCVLGFATSVSFIGVTTFHLPLIASVGAFISLLSVSITLHVYQFVKEPDFPYSK